MTYNPNEVNWVFIIKEVRTLMVIFFDIKGGCKLRFFEILHLAESSCAYPLTSGYTNFQIVREHQELEAVTNMTHCISG
jgi:hypothetical protein